MFVGLFLELDIGIGIGLGMLQLHLHHMGRLIQRLIMIIRLSLLQLLPCPLRRSMLCSEG